MKLWAKFCDRSKMYLQQEKNAFFAVLNMVANIFRGFFQIYVIELANWAVITISFIMYQRLSGLLYYVTSEGKPSSFSLFFLFSSLMNANTHIQTGALIHVLFALQRNVFACILLVYSLELYNRSFSKWISEYDIWNVWTLDMLWCRYKFTTLLRYACRKWD